MGDGIAHGLVHGLGYKEKGYPVPQLLLFNQSAIYLRFPPFVLLPCDTLE